MKILVTGGHGFLGSYIVAHYVNKRDEVITINRRRTKALPQTITKSFELNLPDPSTVDLLRQESPNLLIHAAGTALVGQSIQSPLQDFEQSVQVWAHILDAVRRSEIRCKVIFLSSAAVYGNPTHLPITEDQRCTPISPYGYHKRMCEEIAEYYWRLYEVPIASLRIFSAYGPYLRRQVVWDICQKALNHSQIELAGDGTESRDFIYAADVAAAVECVAKSGSFQAEIYNVASGVSVSIQELANRIAHYLGTKNSITFSGQHRSGDPRFWQADITKLQSLGFVPQWSLEQGLQHYIEWVKQELGKS